MHRLAAVVIATSMPLRSIRSIPSGAASTHTTRIGSGAPRSTSSRQVNSSDPPVASIGSSTKTGRSASVSGSLAR